VSAPAGTDVALGGDAPADEPPGGRRALGVWAVGTSVYLVAVVHRTSLGVAGLDAARRFHIDSSRLSTFSILQVLVYAGMQIPVGLMVDRLGTRRVLQLGIVLFTAGQLGFAFAHSYAPALAARAVLGCGDAMTFVSVLRLGSRWFPARRGPMVAQGTALFGVTGNLLSTVLLSRLLHSAGWTPTFAGTALCGSLVWLLVLLFLRDHPGAVRPVRPARGAARRARTRPSRQPGAVRRQIAAAWREPGTRLGMWTHFTTQFPGMVFLLLWGMPYLESAQGLGRGTASALLTEVVLGNMVFGVLFGQLISRQHGARLPITLAVAGGNAAAWAVVLSWPGAHAPLWLLVLLCVALGACGAASMVGFDFARPANPPERFGTACGIVNIGGFTASMVTLLAVGVLLDATGQNYRVAWCGIFVLLALGSTMILRLYGPAMRAERARGGLSGRVEAVHVPVVTAVGSAEPPSPPLS
jgi:MFS family permease